MMHHDILIRIGRFFVGIVFLILTATICNAQDPCMPPPSTELPDPMGFQPPSSPIDQYNDLYIELAAGIVFLQGETASILKRIDGLKIATQFQFEQYKDDRDKIDDGTRLIILSSLASRPDNVSLSIQATMALRLEMFDAIIAANDAWEDGFPIVAMEYLHIGLNYRDRTFSDLAELQGPINWLQDHINYVEFLLP